MIRKNSLRYRITLGISLLVIAVTGILFIIIWNASKQQEENLIDHIVSEEMDNLIEQYKINPNVKPHQTKNLIGYIAHSIADRKKIPETLRPLRPGIYEVFPSGKEFHVVVRDFDKTRFYLCYDVTYHEKRILEFELMIFSFFVMVTGISLLSGYYISGMLIKPVSDLADRVDNLGENKTSSSLAQLYNEHEVIRLATSFDNYVYRIKNLLTREKSFTSDASHELRTPLTSIKTSCELLRDDTTISEKSRVHIGRIHRGCDRIIELVDDLFNLARGETPSNEEKVNLLEITNLIVDSFEKDISKNKIQINIEIDKQAYITTNSTALHVVISNLLKNSITYTDNGQITIKYIEVKSELSIIDTGIGIKKEDLNLIFTRYFRANSTHKLSKGLGIGLSIVKKFSDFYGWNICINSHPDEGTCARIIFPQVG